MAKPVKCARCGRENDPSFSFCLDCGQPLKLPAAPPAAEKTCLGCGARLPPGFRFCGHCGRPVEPAPAVTPVGRTPVQLGGTALTGEAPPAPARPGPPTPRHLPEPTGPRLSMVRYDGVVGQVFPLAHEATTCGRQAGEVLFPDDLTVSPRHCVFTLRDGRVRVEDLGSASGTFLRLRAPRPVQPGDEIRVGRQLLRLEPLPREARAGTPAWTWPRGRPPSRTLGAPTAPSSRSPGPSSWPPATRCWWACSCSGWRYSLPERPLLLLLLFLAADAEGGHRPGLQPLHRDLILAPFADPEGAVLDARQRLLDLGQEELLPVAQPEDHRLGVLAGGLVDLVGQVVGVEARLLADRLLGGGEDLALRLVPHRLEPLHFLLVQAADLAVWAPHPGRSEERRVGKECRSRWSPYH